MKYEVVRMPTDQDELHETLMTYMPFMDAMYTKQQEEIFGPINFILDHWLFLWDNGAGYFLVGKEHDEIKCVAMLAQYKDLWHGRPRLDIHRFVVADESMVGEQTVLDMIDYLKSVATLLEFDLMFYCTHDEHGNEIRELVWNKPRKVKE